LEDREVTKEKIEKETMRGGGNADLKQSKEKGRLTIFSRKNRK